MLFNGKAPAMARDMQMYQPGPTFKEPTSVTAWSTAGCAQGNAKACSVVEAAERHEGSRRRL